MSSAWPSGFEDQSAPCEFQVQAGGGGGNCQFQVSTPSNLASAWNGCVVLIDNDGDGDGVGSVASSSCFLRYSLAQCECRPSGTITRGRLDWMETVH